MALESFELKDEEIIIKQNGRTQNESAFILVENGVYRGYGFVENHIEINSKTDILAYLIPQTNTLETQQILKNLAQNDLVTFSAR